MRPGSIRRDPGSARRRIGVAVGESHSVEHQLGAVLPLHANPIPPDVSRSELARRPFVVEPARSSDLVLCFAERYFTARFEARKGIIVRRSRSIGGLLADTILSMDGRLLGRAKVEAYRAETRRRPKLELVLAG